MPPSSLLGVPTQINTASRSSVVLVLFEAVNLPERTCSFITDLKYGSFTGDSPLFIKSTFARLLSTPKTVCPSLANIADVTAPT